MLSTLQNIKSDVLVAPQAATAAATVSASVDTVDATHGKANYVRLLLNFASEVNTNAVGPTISVLSCDTTVVTDHATIVVDRSAEDITAAKSVAYHIDMRGKKRYLRLTVTTATHTTNDVITMGATYDMLFGQAPTSAADMADAAVIV